jgi:hypothetical protein
LGHAVDEGNGLDKVGKCEEADEFAVFERPLGQLGQQLGEFFFG